MSNAIPHPLQLHRSVVLPEWIDYNGHMNVAYYVLAFDQAMDAFLDHVDLGIDYVERVNSSIFVAESHICYLNEVAEGARLRFTTQIVGAAAKKFHLFHAMYSGAPTADGLGDLIATIEVMAIHVDLGTRRAAPIPEPQAQRIRDLATGHARIEKPSRAGRSIQL